jgi:PncC family amidohydrolase
MHSEDALEARIGPELMARQLRLIVAESCTGGLLGDRITNVPGSSDYFLGSVVSYADEAKRLLLGVQVETLVQFGAVSRETVLEMAHGARMRFSQMFDPQELISIAISGIAGPGGESAEKPVGLIWIGLEAPDVSQAWRFNHSGTRLENKEFAADKTLSLLMDYLHGQLPPEG